MATFVNMIADNILALKSVLPTGVELVAVSKFHPAQAIEEAYAAGQRLFAESRPQELLAKYKALPHDIKWHFIGHLQTNKIKYIIPFVSLIHSIDSLRLADAVNEQALRAGRVVDVLLQVHIAREDSKQGFGDDEISQVVDYCGGLNGIKIAGFMGMATSTEDMTLVRSEFMTLKRIYDVYNFPILSMGMSDDYEIAMDCGSNMVRMGSKIFGNRNNQIKC
ncbi:Hypothetical protein YggS [Mucinivorans hirudinis]|uniref:Pyridoxal phosphate homeostasis protein n=1 Tax=Mucinivorans hirudinis TaxID=1433126 RepID=A0A060R9N1_9BACT|nr:Hypothetical protein YggS [Mucinivorans hirudinis]